MIKQDPGACEHSVCLAVFLDDPVPVLFCDSIWRIGMKRCLLTLGNFLNLSVQLRGGCLIDTAGLLKSCYPHCLKYPENSGGINIRCELGDIK